MKKRLKTPVIAKFISRKNRRLQPKIDHRLDEKSANTKTINKIIHWVRKNKFKQEVPYSL